MTTHTFVTRCPHCAYTMELHENADGTHDRPGNGDVTMCLKCGRFAIFETRTLRAPTLQELAGIRQNPDCQRLLLAWRMTFGRPGDHIVHSKQTQNNK